MNRALDQLALDLRGPVLSQVSSGSSAATASGSPESEEADSVSLESAGLEEMSEDQRRPLEDPSVGEGFLDAVQGELLEGNREKGIEDLFSGLLLLKSVLEPSVWKTFSKARALEHPLRELIHLDPMTRRSFDKPRGYAGDAPLLDYIYQLRKPRVESGIGLSVYAYATRRPAAAGVRERRIHLGKAIDEAAQRAGRPIRVLSIACGHLREAELSEAMSASGSVQDFMAMDADPASLSTIEAGGFADRVQTVHMPLRSILARRPDWGTFDLVYSAGLYDYLTERTAKRLTSRMFEMLKPGGRLLFTNFLPSVLDAGYMETYMGWELIYRSLEDLRDLQSDLLAEEIARERVFADRWGSIGYVEVDRR